MKSITNKEYEEYMEYKHARDNGQLLTPAGLRIMCDACGRDQEKIGIQLLEALMRIESKER